MQILDLEKQEEEAKTLTSFMGLTVSIITPRPIGSPVENMDSRMDTASSEVLGPKQGDGISFSGVVLNILTIVLIPYLLLVGYQMAFIDPVMSGPAGDDAMAVLMPGGPYVSVTPNLEL